MSGFCGMDGLGAHIIEEGARSGPLAAMRSLIADIATTKQR